MNPIFRTILLVLAPAVVLAESAMPSIGYTGAPADHNGQSCSACHNSLGPANSDKTGSLAVTVTDYNPGVQQMIHIVVSHPLGSARGRGGVSASSARKRRALARHRQPFGGGEHLGRPSVQVARKS